MRGYRSGQMGPERHAKSPRAAMFHAAAEGQFGEQSHLQLTGIVLTARKCELSIGLRTIKARVRRTLGNRGHVGKWHSVSKLRATESFIVISIAYYPHQSDGTLRDGLFDTSQASLARPVGGCAEAPHEFQRRRDFHGVTEGLLNRLAKANRGENLPRLARDSSHLEEILSLGDCTTHRMVGDPTHPGRNTGCEGPFLCRAGKYDLKRDSPDGRSKIINLTV